MDLIRIKDLQVEARVGVTEEERSRSQTLLVQVDLEVDLTQAAASDRLEDTVDYGAVSVMVADLIRSASPQLLEHLAGAIVDKISANKEVVGVTVEVAKLDPPIPETLGSVGVRIERKLQR
jgi:dihydroneopterin aldolase